MSEEEAAPYFEALSSMDRQFLALEDENVHMHVSGFSLYELAPLRDESGLFDFGAFRDAIEATLERIPRYRQRLAFTPIEGSPIWIDACDFDLDYHLRRIALPPPGTKARLQEVVGWIVSQPLDHTKSLWEMWVVEGIDEGKLFAVVTKMHHCMLDGGAGVNLMQLLLRAKPQRSVPEARPFVPRPAPSRAQLAAWELGRRLDTPARLLRGLWRLGAGSPDLGAAVVQRLGAVAELLRNLTPASKTPISGWPLGSHRAVDWLGTPLQEMTQLRRELGCSLNDLVLAIVAGALRRYLGRKSVELEGLDFRVSIPVNIRRESESEAMGNRISSWIVGMPLGEPDPLEQVRLIQERTSAMKSSNQVVAIEMMMALAEELPALLSLTARAMRGQVSMIVTNVPGPPIPLYLLGCRAASMQPLVPLVPGVGLGVALLSYDGTLYWGFQADRDLVPDLERFVADVVDAHRAIQDAYAESRGRVEPAGHSD